MIQLDFLRENSIAKIIATISSYEYVSFDIFDTLLKRDVISPSDVFKIVGQHFNDKTFCEVRMSTESLLRKKCGKEEITLNDIYDALGNHYHDYKEVELKAEEAVLCVNKNIFRVYDYCKQHDKKIIITSDMYLPEVFLKNVLKKNNIDFMNCFISCSYGVKKTTGNLFKKELDVLDITADQIIHIGDSIRGDFLGAKKAGIRGILIPKIVNRNSWINLQDRHQKNMFSVFINNHLSIDKNGYYQFGYSCFGPVLFGFIKWMHTAVGKKKIFFFARDGYIVKKIYDTLYPKSSTDYIYLSRRALSVPLLWKHSEWENFSRYITVTRFFTVETLLERLGLNPRKYKKIVEYFHISLQTELNSDNFLKNKNVENLYHYIQDDIVKNSKDEFKKLSIYFRQKQFQGDVAVMDIGWNGSMQRYLVELMHLLDIDVNIDGYYFGLRKKINTSRAQGYLYEISHMKLEPKISFMQGLFESLFLSQEGSTKRYDFCGNSCQPILYQPEYKEKDVEYQCFKFVQKGAQDFCREYDKSMASKLCQYTAIEYAYRLLKFGTQPTLEEVNLFGDFRFFDTNVVYLAKPRSIFFYGKHPMNFVQDFSQAVWKAGFMKRCFNVRAPYNFLYLFFKRFH